MLFNSFEFALLLIASFGLYWTAKNQTVRNAWMLVASYTFYGFWDWRFLSLIAFSSLVDFVLGRAIYREQRPALRKTFLLASLVVNLGMLGFFKYFNFFVDSFVQLAAQLGVQLQTSTLNIILPVGISFYTFQTLSYTIDIYKKKLKPSPDALSFFAFVSFFPQLVAGPIERAANLLPQFHQKRNFDQALAEDGLRQMLWGFFKKIVIADNAALIVNDVFSRSDEASALVLFIGIFLFSFQIYADFSGYSDIALGVAKLFNINLTTNFKSPYFSTSIVEFWRRWHITLSTWFRDYVYIPLGGSRMGMKRFVISVFATFVLSGLWHGAKLTFVAWGFIHALFYFAQIVFQNNSVHHKIRVKGPRWAKQLVQMVLVFGVVMFSWIFFRSDSLAQAFLYIERMFNPLDAPALYGQLLSRVPLATSLFFVLVLLVAEWFTREWPHPLAQALQWGKMRFVVYLLLVLVIFLFAPGEKSDFIYFQF